MADSKRYYWIKLKDKFMTSDTVDFLMSQKNGANYVVLYQMLCLKCANTNGELKREIGEIIIPYDVHKIQRDCKYFDLDTVIVALGLYKQLGLIYEQEDGFLKIADFDNLIGSESESAERMRRMRSKETSKLLPSQCDTQSDTVCDENVTVEKENRDSLLKILKNKNYIADVYARGNYLDYCDEILNTLVFACLSEEPIRVGGIYRTADEFRKVVDNFDGNKLCETVNCILQHSADIKDTRLYILGIIANRFMK